MHAATMVRPDYHKAGLLTERRCHSARSGLCSTLHATSSPAVRPGAIDLPATVHDGITTTGPYPWWTTCELTEPSRSFLKPPAPREPTTIMSASAAAFSSSSAGTPRIAWTATDVGRESSATSSSHFRRMPAFPIPTLVATDTGEQRRRT